MDDEGGIEKAINDMKNKQQACECWPMLKERNWQLVECLLAKDVRWLGLTKDGAGSKKQKSNQSDYD